MQRLKNESANEAASPTILRMNIPELRAAYRQPNARHILRILLAVPIELRYYSDPFLLARWMAKATIGKVWMP